MGDHEYFRELVEELENSGYEAMLHELQNMKLDGFDVTAFPVTEALQEQKKLSLRSEHKWLVDILTRGYVMSSAGRLKDVERWHDCVTTDVLYEKSYIPFLAARNDRYPISREHFGAFLWEAGFKPKRSAAALDGEVYGKNEASGEREWRMLLNERRTRAYQLGSLEEARDNVTTAFGLDIDWQEDCDED